MTPAQLKKLDTALSSYLDYLTDGMGRPERCRALQWYLTGLLLDGERKTVAAMANRLVDGDGEAEAMRQRLQQCVTISTWADEEFRRRLALRFEQTIQPEAYVVDDTGFPKKGKHSVGVARQYSGTLGRTDNCQVAPSLHVASDNSSGCIGMRLYLPEEWASDIARRSQAGVPEDIVFKRKWEIALDLLNEALAAGLPPRLVLADAGYGDSTEFRDGLTKRGCPYLVGISSTRLAWPPGSRPRTTQAAIRSRKTCDPSSRQKASAQAGFRTHLENAVPSLCRARCQRRQEGRTFRLRACAFCRASHQRTSPIRGALAHL